MTMCLMTIGAIAQDALPLWAQELMNKNPEMVDSIRMIQPSEGGCISQTYTIYYHQPLNHSNLYSPTFPMRATITVFNDTDVTTAVNHFFIGGYALEDWWLDDPDLLFKDLQEYPITEIAHRYRGTLIMPEYRYFQFSAPPKCYENLDDLRSEEAAEDFHNFIEALKKVMKGKWVISGNSKGGNAALLQHAFHPEDGDVFVPYSAPFFDTYCDTQMQHYWLNNGLNQEIHDKLMTIRRTAITRKDYIYPIYHKMMKGYIPSDDEIYARYLAMAAHFGFDECVSASMKDFYDDLTHNRETLARYDIQQEDNDTVCAIMLYYGMYRLKNFGSWYSWLKNSKTQSPPFHRPQKTMQRPFGVKENEWWKQGKELAYEYQSKTELGYYDLRFDEIVGEELAPIWNAEYKKWIGNLRDYNTPMFASCTFDRSLYDHAVSTTKNATKPIIFIYGEDDPWTGAAMKDEYINGTNVRKFILPNQNHFAHFTSNTDKEQCNTICQILDNILSVPQGIDDIKVVKEQNCKVLRNGHIYILRNGKMYNTAGILVSPEN